MNDLVGLAARLDAYVPRNATELYLVEIVTMTLFAVIAWLIITPSLKDVMFDR